MEQQSEYALVFILTQVVQVGNTDLFSKEGHDGEDDERHEDTVRPELQLVPIHSPGRKQQRSLCFYYPALHQQVNTQKLIFLIG